MQYSQEPPNMLLVGGSAIFEKIILAHRFDRFISMLLRRIAPLLMLLVLALHYLAWRFLAAVRPEYGGAVIGLAVLALVIYGFHLTGHGTPVKRGLELPHQGQLILFEIVLVQSNTDLVDPRRAAIAFHVAEGGVHDVRGDAPGQRMSFDLGQDTAPFLLNSKERSTIAAEPSKP